MSGASSSSKAAAPVLALFRSILRLHRERLPPPMRAFGNTLVKDEFSKHLKNPRTSEAQWRTFMAEWQHYHAMLAGNADFLADLPGAGAGTAPAATTTTAAAATGSCGELSEGVLEVLTPDQRARLAALRSEAGRFGRELLTPEGGEGGEGPALARGGGSGAGAAAAGPSGGNGGCGSGSGCGSAKGS